ncbi:unnamed protein product [Urochloa decumbens]|uniref:Cyclin-dependent kinase inhibitor domain-containing protein n=1 Tax=Urochloa decumbens TaxID=240449 RepID=A0ABC9E507_9POAL
MGKYMRKRAGRAPAAELAQVVVGVRTRSRSAAFASAAAAGPPAPKRPRKQAAERTEVEEVEAGHGDGGGCYLRLRSRRLFMAAVAEAPCPVPAEEKVALPYVARSGASGEAPVVVVAGISRCSSTASSVDVVATARERSGGATEARREESDVGSAISDSTGCGRERREATPSSRPTADLSDEDSSQASLVANDKEHRHGSSSANVTTAGACRARTPPEEEIEAFFAAAEKAEVERFSAKYNFDFARGLPLDAAGGRFEWTTVASG